MRTELCWVFNKLPFVSSAARTAVYRETRANARPVARVQPGFHPGYSDFNTASVSAPSSGADRSGASA